MYLLVKMTVLVFFISSSAGGSTTTVLQDSTVPNVTLEQNSFCAYYGIGSCCPPLTPYQVSIQFGFEIQPFYATFAPLSALVASIDNICYTFLPLPDDSNTYQQFISTVYSDGFNTVVSSIGTQKQLGVVSSGSPQCTYLDIMFFNIFEEEISCFTNINYRCFMHGECDRPALGLLPIFGMSYRRDPVSAECLSLVNEVVLSYGFPSQPYYGFPMKLPSRCILALTNDAAALNSSQVFQKETGFNSCCQNPNCKGY